MQVFKLYFKLLKKALPSVLVYFSVFAVITIFLTVNNKDKKSSAFKESRISVVWMNKEDENPFTNTLKDYLSTGCDFVDISRNERSISEALFYDKISAVIVIPEGFTKNFFNGEQVRIKTRQMAESSKTIFLSLAVNRFLNTASLYRDYTDHLSVEQIAAQVGKDLKEKSDVTIFSSKNRNNDLLIKYCNYLSYGLLTVLITGVGMIMVVFQQIDIRQRTMVSPISPTFFQFQIILANFVFTAIVLVVFLGIGYFINPAIKLNGSTLLLVINASIFALCALGISFLTGMLLKNKRNREELVNCVAIAMCFLGGVAVPQSAMDEGLLKMASFVPTYWFVKVNETIGQGPVYSKEIISQIFLYLSIELGFAAAFFIVALVAGKKRRRKIV